MAKATHPFLTLSLMTGAALAWKWLLEANFLFQRARAGTAELIRKDPNAPEELWQALLDHVHEFSGASKSSERFQFSTDFGDWKNERRYFLVMIEPNCIVVSLEGYDLGEDDALSRARRSAQFRVTSVHP